MTGFKLNMRLGSFRQLLFSTWFLATLPAVLVFFFLPPVALKYSVIPEDFASDFNNHKYCDLDSDSISELISTGKGIPYYYVLVQTNDLDVHDQRNLRDSLNPRISECYFGNYDSDRFREIYIFSYKDDSLFLNVREILEPRGFTLERIFITRISVIRKELTSNLSLAGFYDVDADGSKEVYFGIQTGFGLEPRRLYYFDLKRLQVHVTDFTGTICQEPSLDDPDGDGRPEIFGLLTASGNHHEKVPFSDSSTWLMVFNERLRFEFEPVEFPGFTNRLETYSFSDNTFSGYLVSHNTTTVDTGILDPCLMLYSAGGSLIKSRFFREIDTHRAPRSVVRKIGDSDRIFLLGNRFYELDKNLEPVETAESPFSSVFSVYQEDIVDDGDKELLLYSEREGKLVIYGKGFRMIAEVAMETGSLEWDISHNFTIDGKHKLFFTAGNRSFSITVSSNPAYYLGYLLYPGIYLILFLFIFSIKKINTYQVEQRERLKRRLLTMQLQSIKSQLDPHFTFNALNSVASLVYLDDRKAAYDSFSKFTNLIRRLINDAERIYRTLNEELEFVRLYLDLEKLRFGARLNYRIVCDESLTGNELVPKMVLQTFAENAVKHGITARQSGGSLLIETRRDYNYIVLTVQDDGIGRLQSAGTSSSTGKGLKLADEFFDILSKMTNRQIRHTITDLTDRDGNATGTRVAVWIPLIDKRLEEGL